MRKNNRKGFTIVELVIVIAVIAVLAGVLIPTFSGIVGKANESKALQEASNLYKEVYALDMSDGTLDGNDGDTAVAITGKTFTYTVTNGTIAFSYEVGDYTAAYNGTDWTITK